MLYIRRNYRNKVSTDLTNYEVKWKETDLFVSTKRDCSKQAYSVLKKLRFQVEDYIKKYPEFRTKMEPERVVEGMPEVIKKMVNASKKAGVGPMAAVAGAIAEEVGLDLMKYSNEVIVENGGDIFSKINSQKTVAIFAGKSPFSMKIGVKLKPGKIPFGVCTSSGTVGHSISYGNADAVVCISPGAAQADASATAIGNIVIKKVDLNKGLEYARKLGVSGCLIIFGDKIGMIGDIEICKIH